MVMPELYIGLMSGTSLDAIDAVLVDLSDSIRLLHKQAYPLPAPLRERIHQVVIAPDGGSLDEALALDHELGTLFARCSLNLLQISEIPVSQIQALGCHGQTVRHRPSAAPQTTLQLGDPNIIAAMTGITTVSDFRRADMALGGQGAPLAPIFHQALFAQGDGPRVVVNIGGIANITWLEPNRPPLGFDCGPGNALLDAWITHERQLSYDATGAWALQGQVQSPLLADWLADPYFSLPPPKSTGRDYFNLDWLITRSSVRIDQLPAEHIQATLCALTAQTIADAIHCYCEGARDVIICGGGAHNQALMLELQKRLHPLPVLSSTTQGIDPDWIEAIGFAWLAKARLEERWGNVPEVTGARRPTVLGGIYWGSPKSDREG
jgi:anhydro-N-acetylmuramic acid kinase